MPSTNPKTTIATAAFLAAGITLLLAAEDQPHGPFQYRVPEKTNDGWETASLSSQNVDARLITELLDRITTHAYTNIHIVLLVRSNKLVVEQYAPGIQPVIGDTLEQEPD